MEKKVFNLIGYDTRYWWLLKAAGIFFVALGILIIFSGQKAYYFLNVLLAVGVFISGFFEAIFSLVNRKLIKDWVWIFAGGFLDFLLGSYLLNYPMLTMMFMPMVIGIWMLFRAFMIIASAIELKVLGILDWIWLLLASTVLVLPSIVILIDPYFDVINIVTYTGLAFVISGLFRIKFSHQLRKIKGLHQTIHKRKRRVDESHGMS